MLHLQLQVCFIKIKHCGSFPGAYSGTGVVVHTVALELRGGAYVSYNLYKAASWPWVIREWSYSIPALMLSLGILHFNFKQVNAGIAQIPTCSEQ